MDDILNFYSADFDINVLQSELTLFSTERDAYNRTGGDRIKQVTPTSTITELVTGSPGSEIILKEISKLIRLDLLCR